MIPVEGTTSHLQQHLTPHSPPVAHNSPLQNTRSAAHKLHTALHIGVGMASITKYGDGWRAFVYRNGERHSKVFDKKADARAWALQKESDLDKQAGQSSKTLQDAVAHYLKTVSVTKRKPDWEAKRFAAFLEHFGPNTRLANITSEAIGQWRDERLKTVVGATVQREANLFKNLFTVAVDEWRWIDRNPFKGVRMPEQAEARTQVWRWQQIKQVLRAPRDKKTAEVIKAFHIALHTGMRLAEILTGHYDAKRRVYTLPTSKTSTRPVDVPLPRRALKLLPQTFTVGPNEASALFSKLVKQLLLGDMHFHDARATALTLLSRRMDVMTLARISRHRDLSMLLNTYYRESAADIAKRI